MLYVATNVRGQAGQPKASRLEHRRNPAPACTVLLSSLFQTVSASNLLNNLVRAVNCPLHPVVPLKSQVCTNKSHPASFTIVTNVCSN